MRRSALRPRSIALPTLLALSLVVSGAALPATSSAEPARTTQPVPAATAPDLRADLVGNLTVAPAAPRVLSTVEDVWPAALAALAERAESAAKSASPPAKAKPATRAKTSTRATDSAPVYRGRNHVWIPTLGINRSVAFFPCSRTREPDNLVYRWGCAGTNNVYLLGHAHSVFEPLHDAYVSGRLRKGMKVIYADGAGRVSTYRVIWWRVVRPTTDASWAWAAQSQPSMTLQTCVGANSSHRLMVRLVRS